MSKTAAHTKPASERGATRSNAQVAERQNSLGAHICVQREASRLGVQPNAPPLVRNVLNSPGRPLDVETRSFMEPRFGYDFSGVRVHNDEQAAASARAVSANAYTTGSHVVFGTGQHKPNTPGGQRLMAHELAHVVQQASGPVASTKAGEGLSVSHPADPFERTARSASAALSGNSVSPIGDSGPLRPLGFRTSAAESVLQRVDAADAAVVSAKAGVASAIFGGASAVFAGIGLIPAFQSAAAAKRQAKAAEDPPVQEPTTGGITANHLQEIPEVKGVKLKEHEEKTRQKTVSREEPTSREEEVTSQEGALKKRTSHSVQTNETAQLTTTIKEADTADQEKSFTLLHLEQQGTKDSANFMLTIRFNDTDIRGGTTEDGEINGYDGGTNHSNAAVNFRASPGGHLQDGKATVRILAGGTNVPARKTISDTGFFGGGGAKDNPDYVVQRFGIAARFSAGKGEFVGLDTTKVTPPDKSIATFAKPADANADEGHPIASIALAPKGGQANAMAWADYQKQQTEDKEKRKKEMAQ